MAYAAFSVVFGETPSAAKWNILGTNDASFNDGSGFASGAIETASADASEYAFWVPSGNSDNDQASYTDWGAGTFALTVPTWAVTARIQANITSLVQVTGASSGALKIMVGTASGKEISLGPQLTSDRPNISWADEITLTGTGAQTLKIQAKRTAGTGATRASTTSDFDFLVSYHH